MRINTNVASMTALEANKNTNHNLTQSLEKLSSGLRVNKAADDASGLAIADKLRTQASSLKQGIANANSASALIQIADKAMSEQSNILDIVKTKLIQASTSTTTDAGREAIRKDINKLLEQFDMIASETNYNGTTLLQKSQGNTAAEMLKADDLVFQLGETKDFTVTASLNYASNTTGLGGGADSFGTGQTSQALTQDATYTAKSTGTMTFTATANNDKIGVSGVIGKVIADTDIVFTGRDEATRDLLDARVGTDLTKTGSGASATYTVVTDNSSIDFGTNQVNITMSGQAADLAYWDSTKAVNIDVITSASNAATITGTGMTGGETLSGLKSLNDGELTITVANDYMTTVDEALTQLNNIRSSFGSTQNQLESSIRNMQTTHTNLKAAESVIRDVDYAAESANFNKQNIIAQAGTYAISQANNVQQNVLKLLQ